MLIINTDVLVIGAGAAGIRAALAASKAGANVVAVANGPVTESGSTFSVITKATILATGGAAGIFLDNLVGDVENGDGYALAYKAGTKLINLEFIQFMLGLKKNDTRHFLPLPDLNKSGTVIDIKGRDILETHISDTKIRLRAVRERQSHFPFSCCDDSHLVDIAVAHERKLGNIVYWENNVSEVVHYAHAFNGGVEINEKAETTVPGLFSAGEVAAGPHGADRIGGCMMTATQVFGERAGRFAALRAKKVGVHPDPKGSPHVIQMIEEQSSYIRKDKKLIELRGRIRKIFSRNMMTLRNKEGLNTCLQEINL